MRGPLDEAISQGWASLFAQIYSPCFEFDSDQVPKCLRHGGGACLPGTADKTKSSTATKCPKHNPFGVKQKPNIVVKLVEMMIIFCALRNAIRIYDFVG